MQKIFLVSVLGVVSLLGCFHKPPPVVSDAQPGGIYTHQFAPDYMNYGVCHDTLAAIWGKASGNKLNLWVSWAREPLRWEGNLYAGSADSATLREWGSIPAEAPFDFDCRQSLLTPTTQSKSYEIYQSPVQAPFRCATLYEKWLTIVDRKSHKAYLTAMPMRPDLEILEWRGKWWVGSKDGLSEVDPMALSSDLDQDGLTDLLEHLLGTLPDDPDSDQDGTPDALDAQPQASAREWSAADSTIASQLSEKLGHFAENGSCVRYINVVAPDLDPLEIATPPGLRLVWNVEGWTADSLVLEQGAK